VTIQGVFNVQNGIHSIDVTPTFSHVTSSGKAQTLPQPVIISPTQLPSAPIGSTAPAAFDKAYGALVSLQNSGSTVTVSENHAPTLSFKVAAPDNTKTRIATDYPRLIDSTFMPPVDGTPYKAVVGVVATDLGGTVRLRDKNDLISQ
jgi:hypothetical protein